MYPTPREIEMQNDAWAECGEIRAARDEAEIERLKEIAHDEWLHDPARRMTFIVRNEQPIR